MKKLSLILLIYTYFFDTAQAQTPERRKFTLEVLPTMGVSQHNWVENNRFADLPSVGGVAPRTSTETATLATVGAQIRNNSKNRFKFLLSVNYLFGNTNFDGAARQMELFSAFDRQSFQAPLSGRGRYSGTHTQMLIGRTVYSNRRFALTPQIGFTSRRWQRRLPASPDPMVVIWQQRYLLFQYQLGFQIDINPTPNSRLYSSLSLSHPLSFVATTTDVSNVDGGQTIYERRLAAYIAEPFPKTPESIQEAANVLRQMSNYNNHEPYTIGIGGFRTNINLKMGYQYKRWQAEFYYDSFRFALTQTGYNPPVNGYMTGLNVGYKIR